MAYNRAARRITESQRALFLLTLTYTLSMCDRMILSILFPDIKAEFGLSDTQLGLLGGISFALFYSIMGLPIARLADSHNRKWIVITSLLVFSLMTALSGLAGGFISLMILRIGVGVGEAGVNPASHSIIADFFPSTRRASAMSVLMLGASLGMLGGYVGGGFLAETYNWRVALVSVGMPGLVLAVLMMKYLSEPDREVSESEVNRAPPRILLTAAHLWQDKAMRHLIAGSVIAGLTGYGLAQWLPVFFMRTHDLGQTQTGILMAANFGILGAIGAVVMGVYFDRLSRNGFEKGMKVLAFIPFLTAPLFIMGLFAEDIRTSILFFIIPGFAANYVIGPTIAMVQTLAPHNMRAVASAVKMLCLNLVGMGLGPLLVGLFSDLLTPVLGPSALGVALACFTLLGFLGSFHFWLCARTLANRPEAVE